MTDRPNLLLVLSAGVYFAAALALLFAPEELLRAAGAPPSTLDQSLLQVLGSALLGFAMLNWMQRYTRTGGVFGRPLVVANFAHAGSAALLLGRVAWDSDLSTWLAAALVLYGLLAIAFAAQLFGRRSDGADAAGGAA